MFKTKVEVRGTDFYINGKKTYSDITGSKEKAHGLLMNARFIQGIFEDKQDPRRFNRFGKDFDPDENTEDLIKALPQWYSYGLRAFTLGLQGGGPCFTMDNESINNNPFSADGTALDEAYLKRMDAIIRAADALGMVVIVSYFYHGQIARIKDGRSVLRAVKTASSYLKNQGYSNVIIEVCNEMNNAAAHDMTFRDESMAVLIETAKEESGGMLVGTSGAIPLSKETLDASDIILFHGNDCSVQQFYNKILKARKLCPGKPLLCNEDSQAIGRLGVCYNEKVSWGYYNNMTKQEPPIDYAITRGEDLFFAHRMAEGIGLTVPEIPFEEQYYLQGLEPNMTYREQRWLRVASLYPESINYVEFYNHNQLVYTAYEESFSLNFYSNWKQDGITWSSEDSWSVKIYLRDGRVLQR